ncbi:HEAT repeat domain-containing protein [Halosimplex aquaticum]
MLAYVAEHRPDAVAPVTASLATALNDSNPDVRASAVLALGEAGDESVLAELRAVTEDDPDERVRATARTVVDRIESDE